MMIKQVPENPSVSMWTYVEIADSDSAVLCALYYGIRDMSRHELVTDMLPPRQYMSRVAKQYDTLTWNIFNQEYECN